MDLSHEGRPAGERACPARAARGKRARARGGAGYTPGRMSTASKLWLGFGLLLLLMVGIGLFVAHRLATIRDADLILVFQNGRIIERGNFQDLVRQGGFFAQLVATQFQNPAMSPDSSSQDGAQFSVPSDNM